MTKHYQDIQQKKQNHFFSTNLAEQSEDEFHLTKSNRKTIYSPRYSTEKAKSLFFHHKNPVVESVST